MTLDFLQQNTSNYLTIIFAGWGMSASDFGFLQNCYVETRHATSLLVCSDYRTLDFDFDILKPYTDIRLIGYSLGVWAASYVFRKKDIAFSEKIAISGTQYPVDNKRGIPTLRFEGTEQLLSETTLRKFFLRMCGCKQTFEHFTENIEKQNIDHLKNELRVVQQLSAQHDVSDFQWDKAIISTNDAIFPAENQREAWKNNPNVEEINVPHFSKDIFSQIVAKDYP